jgi:class 3 adenylate cyclase/tetratricopeptide (TPR) repeat protein
VDAIVGAPEPGPIVLTILRDEGCLALGLTDMRSAGCLARVSVGEGVLEELRERAALVAANGCAPDAVRQLGHELFSRLLAAPVQDFLVGSPRRGVYLQLDDALLDLPWESAHDGECFLGDKFPISRQIVSRQSIPPAGPARAPRELLRVLLVRGDAAAHAEALSRRLEAIDGLRVTSLPAGDLTHARTLKLIGEHDVVHYVGPMPDPAAIAALPARPQLLIAETLSRPGALTQAGRQHHRIAKAACLAGLNLLVAETGPAGSDGLQFMQILHTSLAEGATIGEAARRARAMLGGRSGNQNCLRIAAALYGEGSQALVSRADTPPREDNRRQVTILSCDIVDSTSLLKTLGDEKYSEMLERYRSLCAAVVSRHGGYIEESKGDGILCLFGYPVAHEDSAARSLRAAREILGVVASLEIEVRMGLATGQVAVTGRSPVGDVIHFTIRLQAGADAGTIFVSESTRRMVRDKFNFQRIRRKLELKGFDQPGPVYRLLSEAQPGRADPFDAAPRLTPFIGRADELRLLELHWSAVRAGAARAVRISGEAGIGKSRLVREFRRSLSARDERAMECRCTPEHASSAFYPVIDFLLRFLNIRRGDSVEHKLDKIGQMIAPGEPADAVPLIAQLLSIPFESRYPPLRYSGEKQRQRTLEALVDWIRREAHKAPLCLIIEDIHWIDPSTRELVNRLVHQAARLRLLVLVTVRAEAVHAWSAGVITHDVELKGVSLESARAMVIGVSGDAKLPAEIVRLLAARADGVPLFIEESTRMALDVGIDAVDGARTLPVAVPDTLNDLLMARLDRLMAAKPVAQLGGTIGREFSLALIESVLADESSPIRIDNLPARLGALVDSGLLIEKGEAPNTSYFFKHALVRDAAYQSLWERDRKRLHRAIATVISEKFKDLGDSQPELLAHHCTEAGLEAQAIAYWEQAARRAASRSAHDEAISHLTKGLELLGRQAPGAERDRIELRFQLLLAGRLIATEGYGAERVERVYTRASELCRVAGDESSQLKVGLGLEGYHFMRANFAKAHEFANQAAAMVARSADPVRRLQSQWALGNILFHQGDGVAALGLWDAGLAEYDKTRHRPSAVQDPGVMCLCYSAWVNWQLGYPDQALQRAAKVVALSTELNHPFSMGEAYGFCTAVHHFRGESEKALQNAARAIEICEDGGFAVWLAHARLMHGRIVADLGDPAAGIEEMRLAYEMWAATGAVVTRPFYLAQQAEGLALAGRADDGLAVLENAFNIVRKYSERYYEAEIRRLVGDLILQSAALHDRDRNDEAERWFLGALEVARSQKFRSMELRSALSLARLWSAQGRGRDAVQLLEPAYNWFSEGRKTGDLVRAQNFLEELRRVRA